MAYTALDRILADHYNTFVAGAGTFGIMDHDVDNINTVWGEGFGDKGYGQSTIISQVPVETTVSATQWATLITRLLASDDHQGIDNLGDMPGDGGAGGPALTGGDLIEAVAAMQANVTSVFDNRLTAIATASTQVEDADASSSWDVSSVHTINVQFADADAVRYFFNAGGNIAISATRTGGGSGEDNAAWDTLLSDVNIVQLGAHGTNKIGGGGAGTVIEETAIGYYELDTGAIQTFRQYASGAYATDNLKIEVATNGTQGANGDAGDLVTFTVTLEVGAPPAVSPAVDGTTTVTATVNFPATTYLTEAAWGSVTFVPASGVVQS